VINRFIVKFKNRWDIWIRRRNRPGNPQIVDTRNLYILPTAFGWAYGVLLFILLIGAVNYQNNLVFLLTFILAIIGMVSACEAHGNILNLSIKLIDVEDSEAGRDAKVAILVESCHKKRFGILMGFAGQQTIQLGKLPVESTSFIIPISSTKRGYFSLPPLIISSIYPFGIFRVWSYAFFDEHYYVYPHAENPDYWPAPEPHQQGNKMHTTGDDEYYDLKSVENPWSDPKMIAWKIAAKGQGWFLKRMHSHDIDHWLFKLSDLQGNNIETKLANLAYWLQTAEANGQIYGLAIGDTMIPIAQGKEHLQQCLRQLAVYQ
jgi:uncharacterized protein (DUF58 family)